MKNIIYYLAFLLLLFIINILPTSALEINTCKRSIDDLKVKEELKNDSNIDDILETPCVDASSKIYDFADLLTDTAEQELFNSLKDFKEKSNYDLVIVTILENMKENAQTFADDFYDYNDFGENKTRDGLLILIDMDNREIYIGTTGYAIKMYDDERITSIIDAGYSSIQSENYKTSLEEMIESINYYFSKGFPSSNKNLFIDEVGRPYYIRHIPYILIIVISIIVTTVVSLIFYFKTNLKIKVLSTVSYLKSKQINLEKDRLVNTVITHVPRYDGTSSNGGGSSGGGSTFHSSSSGSFHGGGGRHF